MLPTFPAFKKYELRDRKYLQEILQQFSPHSDINPAGLWSYNTHKTVELSQLYGNIIIKTRDYLSPVDFFTLIGSIKLNETVLDVFKLCQKNNIAEEIHLVSEEMIPYFNELNTFDVQEDINNFDYILDIENLIEMKGKNLDSRRYGYKRFIRDTQNIRVSQRKLTGERIKKEVLNVFNIWANNKQINSEEYENEKSALIRLLQAAHVFNIYATCIYVSKKLIAFSIDEVVHKEYGIIHFEKADTNYYGSYEYLKHQSAVYFQKHKCRFINYEQDLGLEHIRRSKSMYKPIRMHKKYKISPINKLTH